MLDIQNRLFSIREAANILGVSTKTLRRWDQQGRLVPTRTAGNQRRYSQEQIQEFKNQTSKDSRINRGPAASFPPASARSIFSGKPSAGELRAVGSPSTGVTPPLFDLGATPKAPKATHSLPSVLSGLPSGSFLKNHFLARGPVAPSSRPTSSVASSLRSLDGTPSSRTTPRILNFQGVNAVKMGFVFASLVLILSLSGAFVLAKYDLVKGLAGRVEQFAKFIDNLPQITLQIGPKNTDLSFVPAADAGAVLAAETGADLLLRINVPVIVGTEVQDPSAIFSIASEDKGFLAPRMTEAQIQGISAPAAGLFVYNTDTNHYNMYNGTSWQGVFTAIGDSTTGEAFTETGASGTSLYFYDADGRGQLTIANLGGVRKYTLPDASGEVSLLGQTIGNSELVNSKVTVSAGTNLTGGGEVALGSSVTLTLKDSVDLSGTLIVGGAATLKGALTANANVTLGDAAGDTITFTGRVAQDSDLIPVTATGTNDLGTSALPWDNVYADNVFAASSGTSGYWQRNSSALSPTNITDDILIGATSTSSAKIAFINIAAGTPTATISGDITLDAAGILRTTKMQTLTLGSSATGNIVIDSGSSAITLSDDTTISGDLAVNGGTSADITSTTTTGTLFNATVTTLSLGGAATTLNLGATDSVTRTINLGTGTGADTINVGTGATTANTVNIGTGAVANTIAIGSSSTTTLSLTDDNWSITAAGLITTADDIALNGGDLTTTATTFNLVNATATTVNFAGAGTTVSIGAATGTTTINNATAAVTGNLTIAGTTGITLSGGGAGITFSGTGNHDITASAGTLRLGALTLTGSIVASAGGVNMGTSGTRLGIIYADEVNATTLVGTLTGGNTNAATLTINADNATADTEDATIAFERGTSTPNALITWNSTTKQISTNSPSLAILPDSGIAFSGTSALIVNQIQAQDIFTASASGTTRFTVANSGNTTIAGDLAVNGGTSADITSTTTTGTLFNATVTTLSLGGAATTLNLGTTDSVTRTINLGTGTGADTINIGTGATTANTVNIGTGAVANTIAIGSSSTTGLSLTDDNWSISTAGLITTADDAAVNGGDITTTATTFNLVNATATTVNFAQAATTLTMGATTGTATIRNATVNFPNATLMGIGNTAPLTALDVTGSASLSANLSLRGAATSHTFNILDNGTLNFQRSPGGDAGLATALFIQNNGNVGIGTASPSDKLHILGAGGIGARLEGTNASLNFVQSNAAANNKVWRFVVISEQFQGGILPDSEASVTNWLLVDRTGTTVDSVAFPNGNVGIGTTSPSTRLQISVPSGTSITKPAGLALLNTTGTAGQTAGIRFDLRVDGAESASIVAIQIAPDLDGSADLAFITRGGGGGGSTSEKMRILGAGNVGIGTTAPTSILAFGGDAARTIQLEARTTNAAGSALSVVAGAGGSGATGVAGGQLNLTGGAAVGTTGAANGGDVRIMGGAPINGGSTGNVILATTAGSVGIGTATPATGKLLDVQGEVQINFPTAGATTIGVCKSIADGTAADQNLVECSGTPGDIAEWYAVQSDVEAGDIVAVSPNTTFNYEAEGGDPWTGQVIKLGPQNITVLGKAAANQTFLGIASTAPFQTFGEDIKKAVETSNNPSLKALPIALTGRVPVKVSLENGPIAIGDSITSSSTPGVGMKATQAGRVIGMALESYDGTKPSNKILVFVNPHWMGTDKLLALDGNNNLGIGTTTPSFKLDVQDMQTASNAAAVARIFNTADGIDADGLVIKLGNTSATEVALTNSFINFETSGLGIVGSISGNGAKGVTYATSGIADFAEYFRKDPNQNIEFGSVMCLNEVGFAVLCGALNSKILGIASERPAFLGGENLGSGSITVGLVGQVETLVSSANGEILPGDALTSSDIPGVAVKATKPGQIVGKALEGFKGNTSEVCRGRNTTSEVEVPCGKILVSVSIGWYDPLIYIASDGTLSGAALAISNTNTTNTTNNSIEISDQTSDSQLSTFNYQLENDPLFKDLKGKVDSLQSKLDLLSLQFEQQASVSGILEASTASNAASASAALGVALNATAVELNSATITDNLMVLGRTTVTDLGVTGNINAGLLSIHGLSGELNTLAGDLRLQSNGLGGVNILAGKVVVDTKGNMTVAGTITAKQIEAENYTVLGQESIGSSTIPAGSTSVEVATSIATASSKIFLTMTTLTDKQVTVVEKQSGKFKVAIPQPTTSPISFDWWIVGNKN